MGQELSVRPANWPELLYAFIESRRTREFNWGTHDCALFPADWVKELTDYDPAHAFRGKYSTEFGAAKQLIKLGARSLFDTWTQVTHEPCQVAYAGRGDVVGFMSNGHQSLGICVGSSFFAPGLLKLEQLPMNSAIIGWKV